MAQLKQIRVTGSTLVEVLVAFVIVMLVFSFATTVIVQTYQSETGLPLLKSIAVSDLWKEETVRNMSYFDETIEKSGLVYERRITNYKFSKKILQIEIRIYTHKKEHEITRLYYLVPIPV